MSGRPSHADILVAADALRDAREEHGRAFQAQLKASLSLDALREAADRAALAVIQAQETFTRLLGLHYGLGRHADRPPPPTTGSAVKLPRDAADRFRKLRPWPSSTS